MQVDGQRIALIACHGKRISNVGVSDSICAGMPTVKVPRDLTEGLDRARRENHSNVPDDEGARRHENAWGYVLARMASRFGKREYRKATRGIYTGFNYEMLKASWVIGDNSLCGRDLRMESEHDLQSRPEFRVTRPLGYFK